MQIVVGVGTDDFGMAVAAVVVAVVDVVVDVDCSYLEVLQGGNHSVRMTIGKKAMMMKW